MGLETSGGCRPRENKETIVIMDSKPRKKVDILIIEDDEFVRSVLTVALTEEGFNVMEASTGASALEALRETLPSVVLLDIGLPDMEGFEICKMMRDDGFLTDVPVIIVSGRSSIKNKFVGFLSGAKAFVDKPFQVEDLIEKVSYFAECGAASEQQLYD